MKKIIYTSIFLISALPILASADVKTDMMSDKIDRLEQDLNALQRKIYQSEAPTTNQTISQNSNNSNLDDLYNRLAEQNNVIRDLTAKIEKLEFKQQQLNDRLNKMNTDIDMRFNMQQNTSQFPVNEQKVAAITEGAKSIPPKEAYDTAYNLMKKGDYTAAEIAFVTFMHDYPQSDLTGNANYWLGETYYARGEYEKAVGIFADGFTKYKKNSKAADNLLKLGLTMNKLKKKTDACTAFKSLPTEFPKASNSIKERAKAEAKKLSCK